VDPAGANDTLLPRKQVVSVGYSFKSELADDADTVDGQHASDFAPLVHNHDADYVNEGQADSVTSSMIVDGTIVDADINAGANIAASKINTSGLDADLLDGVDSTGFVSTSGDDMTGTLAVNTSSMYALYSISSGSPGFGLRAEATATSGYGVYGTAPTYGIYGYATATSGSTHGVSGFSASTFGRGVFGTAAYVGVEGKATATSGSNFGVYGASASTSGRGVEGRASATSGTNYGVFGGSSSTSGRGVAGTSPYIGVRGYANGTSGINYGVQGISLSTSGKGVYGNSPYIGVDGYAGGTSETTYGVHGESNSTGGYGVYGTAPTYGVYGEATATSGGNRGVVGISHSTDGVGVWGYSPDYGVAGESTGKDGVGVFGWAMDSIGTNYGVYGRTSSASGYAVYGYGRTYGVFGHASAGTHPTYGVYGQTNSPEGYGVYGEALPTSGVNYGVYGITNSSSGFAGFFLGRVHVTGNLTVGGSKPCVQPIDNGKKVLLYAMESPEIWFEDFGTAQLVNGQAVVPIESVFAQTANIEMGYLIFLTPRGECQGLYIAQQDKDSFEVRELGAGTSNISFYYRIVAKRRGYEDVRFEEFTEPKAPPEEPNLPIEKKEAKVKQPKRQ